MYSLPQSYNQTSKCKRCISSNAYTEIKLFTNDKAGKSGRAHWYITDKNVITSGREYLNKWKVIVSSANAGGQKRSNQIAIIDNHSAFGRSVSIRPTTGIKPLYTTIATVTMNLIVSAAIVLLNPYVTVYISYKIPPFALSVHIPDVSTSIYVEVDSKVLLGLLFCDKAFVR